MASPEPNGSPILMDNGMEVEHTSGLEDPFTTSHASQNAPLHRYSAFDTQLFALNATSSPGQVKRTLEAHIAETDRRLSDTSKLGTTLLEQRKELQDKLQEIEKQHDDAELTPELRERLLELEKEYNEVGRDSARVILAPKSRVVSAEDKQVPGSPAHFSSQATASPTKVSVPNRKQRNQTSSLVGDIQFAADITTSLLAQVRQLQGVVAERDDALRSLALEKSKLELESEGLTQRVRALDESEQRYKDENWNLETQTHELMAAVKESATREKKLTSTLAAITAEKTRAQNELDELKLAHGKLTDDHSAAQKAHDSELHTMRRTADMADSEKLSLQNRIEELTNQNQELAKAVASRFRARDSEGSNDYGFEPEDLSRDASTPEHSPPPSPTKGTPRHPGLESETLKSSLHHAHRMIQNLKGSIHREKTEKIELKRMLQDARDELEQARSSSGGPGSASKRQKTKNDPFKKPSRPDLLGANRRGRTEVEIEDAEWQDHDDETSPRSRQVQPGAWPSSAPSTDLSDAYQTANETDAFDTAYDRETATESEAFQTGAESLAGDSTDELTETEASTRGGTIRAKRPAPIMPSQMTFQSTASTSSDDDDDAQTPVQSQPKYRLRFNKFLSKRRSRNSLGAEPQSAQSSSKNSPASFYAKSPPVEGGQSLFAELDAAGSDGEFGTPSRSVAASAMSTPSGLSQSASKGLEIDPFPMELRPSMVDSSMMTEPWSPAEEHSEGTPVTAVHPGSAMLSPATPNLRDSSTQWSHEKGDGSPAKDMSSFITPPKTVWDEEHDRAVEPIPFGMSSLSTQETEPVEATPPTPVRTPLGYTDIAIQHTEPVKAESPVPVIVPFAVSHVSSQATEPVETETPAPVVIPFAVSHGSRQATEPVEAELPAPVVVPFVVSHGSHQATEPVEAELPVPVVVPFVVSHGSHQATEPVEAELPAPVVIPFAVSHGSHQTTEPVEAEVPAPIVIPFGISQVSSQHSVPIEAELPAPVVVPFAVSHVSSQATEPVEAEIPAPKNIPFGLSHVSAQETTPIESATREIEAPIPVPIPIVLNHAQMTTQATEPVEAERAVSPALGHSQISSQASEPVEAEPPVPATLAHAGISSQATEPVEAERAIPASLGHAAIASQSTEPLESERSIIPVPVPLVVPFAHSDVSSQETVPVEHTPVVAERELPPPIPFSISQFSAVETTPIEPVKEEPPAPVIVPFAMSELSAFDRSPIEPVKKEPPAPVIIPFAMSGLSAFERSPVEHVKEEPPAPVVVPFTMPKLSVLETTPIEPVKEEPPVPTVVPFSMPQLSTLETTPIEPVKEEAPAPVVVPFSMPQLSTLETTPIEPVKEEAPAPVIVPFAMSGLSAFHRTPIEHIKEEPPAPVPVPFAMSNVSSFERSPIEPVEEELPAPIVVPFSMSNVSAFERSPIEPVKDEPAPPASLAYAPVSAQETTPIEPVREEPAPPAPLAYAQVATQETAPIAPTPAGLGFSQVSALETTPVEPEQIKAPVPIPFAYSQLAAFERSPIEPEHIEPAPLAYAEFNTQETTPIAQAAAEISRPSTAKKIDDEGLTNGEKAAIGAGLLGSAAAAFGISKAAGQTQSFIAEDETSQEDGHALSPEDATRSPLRDISGNTATMPLKQKTPMSDQGAQTLLTSAQIDKALMQRIATPTSPTSPTASGFPFPQVQTPASPRPLSRGRIQNGTEQKLPANITSPRRPGSAGSVRQSLTVSYPPLPPDHKQVIEAAGGKPAEVKAERGLMGPPLAPASAMRRPRTPGDQNPTSPRRNGATSRTRSRQGATSQLSRRSSVSSFASELDERFNIAANGMPGGHAFEPGTDPRMIQAITQTMIGEFLWKYTRKAGGRGDMSMTRHRRYFWVHPYTKTLYWSDQDPQTAGRSELKAKSVAIQAVRVVTDDNPMPPGLHRKSIEVITPGRKVKFTAATGSRHETWFNALSYLLLRNQEEEEGNAIVVDPTQLTAEDVDEFNPGMYNRSNRPSDRVSLSSYNSRTTQNTAIRASSRVSNRASAQHSESARPTLVPQDSISKGSISRLSNMFKGSIGYGRSRSDGPQVAGEEEIYNASLVEDQNDSAEDLRQKLLQQEREADRLENVRACCDGKHDVSTLSRNGRHSHKHHSHSTIRRG